MENQGYLFLKQKGIDPNKPSRLELNKLIRNIEDDEIAEEYKNKFISLREISNAQLRYLWAMVRTENDNALKEFINNLK